MTGAARQLLTHRTALWAKATSQAQCMGLHKAQEVDGLPKLKSEQDLTRQRRARIETTTENLLVSFGRGAQTGCGCGVDLTHATMDHDSCTAPTPTWTISLHVTHALSLA